MKQKWAVVTGGARNIGQAIGQRLLADGFRVISLDILTPEEPALQANAVRVDLSDRHTEDHHIVADEDLATLYQETCISKISQYNDINEFRSFLQTSENPSWLNTLLIDTFRNYDSRRDGCLVNEPASPEVLKFIRRGKTAITTRTNFVGQHEAAITKRLLQEMGIYLDIKASKFSQLLNIENRITLYNIGAGHYQYFRPVASSRAASIDDTFTVVSERRPLSVSVPTPAIPSTVTVVPKPIVSKPIAPNDPFWR